MDEKSRMKNLYSKFSGVVELTTKDFQISDKKMTVHNPEFKDKYGLIAFYAPWCGHCKAMVEMWSDLAIQFKHKFAIGSVNCENKNNYLLCSHFRIKYYPTIKYVTKNGIIYDYEGGQDKDDMLYFICSKL